MEIWKDIEGYEGKYQVSSEGRVRSLNYNNTNEVKELKLDKRLDGYVYAGLSRCDKVKFYRVHRLVAQAFIPNLENKPYTDHINGIRDDNRVENLRWCSPQENSSFPLAIEHFSEAKKGKTSPTKGMRLSEEHKRKISEALSIPVYQYSLDKELVAIWPSAAEAGRNGFNNSTISKCCRGIKKTHKGFIFSYVPL